MNNIQYFSPKTLEEGLDYLAKNPDVRILAGGTDLVAKWKKSGFPDMSLMDIRNIEGFKKIELIDNKKLFIGAGATMAEVCYSELVLANFPILAEAARKVGSVQVRNMATIGGNSCNAAPSADTVLPMLVYDADAIIVAKGVEKKCKLAQFFLGPGKTILQSGEMLKGFYLPLPCTGSKAAFVKHSRRAGMDLATVGVAVNIACDSEKKIESVAIALGAVGPTPILVSGMDKYVGRTLSKELILSMSKEAASMASPITDVRGSKEYREDMLVANISLSIEQITGVSL